MKKRKAENIIENNINSLKINGKPKDKSANVSEKLKYENAKLEKLKKKNEIFKKNKLNNNMYGGIFTGGGIIFGSLYIILGFLAIPPLMFAGIIVLAVFTSVGAYYLGKADEERKRIKYTQEKIDSEELYIKDLKKEINEQINKEISRNKNLPAEQNKEGRKSVIEEKNINNDKDNILAKNKEVTSQINISAPSSNLVHKNKIAKMTNENENLENNFNEKKFTQNIKKRKFDNLGETPSKETKNKDDKNFEPKKIFEKNNSNFRKSLNENKEKMRNRGSNNKNTGQAK